MTSETTFASSQTTPAAVRLSFSNLASLVAMATEPGVTRGHYAITLRDGTVIEIVPDAIHYKEGAPALDPDAFKCKRALERLAQDRAASVRIREATAATLARAVTQSSDEIMRNPQCNSER